MAAADLRRRPRRQDRRSRTSSPPAPRPLIALTLQTLLIGAFALAGVLLLF